MWMIFFFFNDTATTEIYTLSLHDALPICAARDVDSIRNALHGGVLHYLVKPFDRRTFEARLRDYAALRGELAALGEAGSGGVDRLFGPAGGGSPREPVRTLKG